MENGEVKSVKSNFLTNKPVVFGLVLIISGVFVYFMLQNLGNTIENYSDKAYFKKYKSPIGKGIKFEEKTVTLEEGKTSELKFKNGAVITMPFGSIVNEKGEVVKGKIQVKYRQFSNQKDIFLSGIPMEYDSAGQKFNFESGGMFEVLAYQNNSPLFIDHNKSITVQFQSKQIGNYFNQYYLNPDGEWEFVQADPAGFTPEEIKMAESILQNSPVVQEIQKILSKIALNNQKLNELENQKPILPKQQNKENLSFKVESNAYEFPELILFKGVLFEVDNSEKSKLDYYSKLDWENLKINKLQNDNLFNICFSNKEENTCFTSWAVYNENDFKEANKSYNDLIKNYTKLKSDILKKEDKLKKKLNEKFVKLNEQKIVTLNQLTNNQTNNVMSEVTRKFQIASFGVWNCDYPSKIPNNALVKPKFYDDNGERLIFSNIYLVLIDRNEIINLNASTFVKGIGFDPNQKTMIWGVCNEGKSVAIYPVEKFALLTEKDTEFNFKMKMVNSLVFEKLSTDQIFAL